MTNTSQNDKNIKKNKEQKKNVKSREEYGFGYEKSIDDLNVIGQNNINKNNSVNLSRK